MPFRHNLLAALTHPWTVHAAFPLTRGVAPILMFHRFADPAAGAPGHDPQSLGGALAELRRMRFDLIALAELLNRLETGAPLYKTVAFTVDDGYGDFARVGAPVFAAFDCPVTVFVITGFLDGTYWPWWDRVEFTFVGARGRAVELELPSGPAKYAWVDPASRSAAILDLVERLKRIPEAEKEEALTRLARALDVEVPAVAPTRYAPMSWDDARSCARAGVTVGPHTVTHPILSRVDDARSTSEIETSWRRVREEVPGALPMFCYPNGDPDSFGERELATLSRLGLRAAVTTVPEFAAPLSPTDGARYHLPRLPYLEDRNQFLAVVTGVERGKRAVRRWLGH